MHRPSGPRQVRRGWRRGLLALVAASLALGSVPAPPTAAATVTYLLPWMSQQRWTMTAGWNGTSNHYSTSPTRYAYDFDLRIGTPVLAAATGRIVAVKRDSTVGGCDKTLYAGKANYVVIAHADGLQTLYLHLKSVLSAMVVGTTVRRGQLLGYSGQTGYSCGAHLHFQLQQPFTTAPTGVSVKPYFAEYPGVQIANGTRLTSRNVPVSRFSGNYFANASFVYSSTTNRHRLDSKVAFDWSTNSPFPTTTFPANYFSVRWEGLWPFPTGRYRFTVTHDYGMRVWVNGVRRYDRTAGTGVAQTFDVSFTTGDYRAVRIDYTETTGAARASVNWAVVP